jgi:hypothetical protein
MQQRTESSHPQLEALSKLEENPRVSKIRIIVAADACPACREQEGEYEKGEVPELPTQGCSHRLGCRCYYSPKLEFIFP